MSAAAAWLASSARRWPPPAAPDPFLPRSEQLRQGVPRASAAIATEEARVVFDRLLSSAPEVFLSVPDLDEDAPLLPSPFLAGIAELESPPCWQEPRVAQAQYTQRPSLQSLTDGQLPPVAGDESTRGGARLLELQSACPFRAQAELRLGARALEVPGVGVDAAERGDLVHVALAELWRRLGDQDSLKRLDAAGVQAAVRQAVVAALAEARHSAGDVLQHLLDLEAEWLESRLLEITDADRARPPFAIESLEQPCTARIGRLTLELRPDRVDRLQDGSLAVIDYKTGANADVRAWLDERPRWPQLPAYVQALGPERVAAVAFARVRSGRVPGRRRAHSTRPARQGSRGIPPGGRVAAQAAIALAYPGQQNTELDTATNAESWAGATYDIYSGGWQTCFVTTLNGHRGGNTIVELIGSGFCNGWDHVVEPASGFVINEKFLSTRIRVNGVTIAEQGGIPHGVQTFRLFGAVQLPPGNHEVAVDWRGVGPTANEPVREYTGNEPILRYHLFNMTFAAYARFR